MRQQKQGKLSVSIGPRTTSIITLLVDFFFQTLIMDEHRLSEMRWNIHRTTLIGTILLVTMNTIGRQLAGDAGYLAKLKEVVYILLDGVPEW